MLNNKATILVVDDNKMNIDILLGTLNIYDIIPALSGKDALAIVKKENIDLILLDVMMPFLDGFEVCRILKNDPKHKDIPIIFLTAKNEQEDIKKGFQSGAIDYIVKPFNPIELNIRIETHIELISYRKELEKRVSKELEANKINQQILFQKSKQAEIGELMMHISHQWKQPLSELGSINTLQIGKLEKNGLIDKKEHQKYLEKNGKIISFMSDTMETFQNFYKPDQGLKYFDIVDAIKYTINIVAATFDFFDIKLIFDEDDRSYITYGNMNEYSQVILSILNNAKAIFIKREIKNRNIKIDIKLKRNYIVVTIRDNGGGIIVPDNCDIFSLFTSFSDSTGVGLYLVKAICKKNYWDIEGLNDKDGAKFMLISKQELI